jgi:flagellar hook-associated protein 2
MSPIGTFSGLASGIQWRDMIEQIMKLEMSRRLTPLSNQVDLQQKRREAWSSYNRLLSNLATASTSLRDRSAFGTMMTSVALGPGDKTLFTASASSAAAPASYQIEVIAPAKAEKLSGASFSSTSAQLGIGGEFFINGRRLEISGTATLVSIRDAINSANTGANATGVTATILSTGPAEHRLVLTSDHTGARGIELVDGATSPLRSLGVLSGTMAANTRPGDPATRQTHRFTSSSTVLSTMLGLASPPAVTTIKVDGKSIQVDLENDTLLSFMNRLHAENIGASISTETVGGRTMSRLDVAGEVTADVGAADPAASQRIVELLGFVRSTAAAPVTAGSDAVFTIDGFAMTRRSNTVTDAIAGVTLNLMTANASQRTSSLDGANLSLLADPKTIGAGSYVIAVQTSLATFRSATPTVAELSVAAYGAATDGTFEVSLTHDTVRSVQASNQDLQVLAAPGAVAPGSYDVQVTVAASVANRTGSAFSGTYDRTGLPGLHDTLTITDGDVQSASIELHQGDTLAQIVSRLNDEFTVQNVAMQASSVGGQLRLHSTTDPGSASSFTVSSSDANVAANLGIADGAYVGSDVQGTIGGLAATGSGNLLTGAPGALDGLQVRFTGDWTGGAGFVTISDTTTVTGGTIGGEPATWDGATGRLTADAGSPLAGLSISYTGTPQTGAVGSVTLATHVDQEAISGATINGVAAVWDAATSTVRGATGSAFAGLVLGYDGPVTAGSIGTLTVQGDIAVELKVTRELESAIDRVGDFAAAYNELVSFVQEQRESGSPLHANGALRVMQGSLTNVLLRGVDGLAASNPYTHTSLLGISLTKEGMLEVSDVQKLREALRTNLSDVREFFSKWGTPSDPQVAYLDASDATRPGSYAVVVTAAATRASHAGSQWLDPTYAAGDGVSDVLTIADAVSGKDLDFTVLEGKSLSQLIAELNASFATEGMSLTAAEEGGGLRIRSTEYGSEAVFTLSGSAAGRLGLTAGAHAGSDVEGTIGGVAASGKGRVLTGSEGEAEGLRIRYTGTTARDAGEVRYVLGLGGTFEQLVAPLTRPGDGTIPNQIDFIDRSIESLAQRAEAVEARLEVRRAALIRQYTRMEGAMSLLQSQSNWLSTQLRAMQPPDR